MQMWFVSPERFWSEKACIAFCIISDNPAVTGYC
jgi:hypothetical protein